MKYKPFPRLECSNEKTATETANKGEKSTTFLFNVNSNVKKSLQNDWVPAPISY